MLSTADYIAIFCSKICWYWTRIVGVISTYGRCFWDTATLTSKVCVDINVAIRPAKPYILTHSTVQPWPQNWPWPWLPLTSQLKPSQHTS